MYLQICKYNDQKITNETNIAKIDCVIYDIDKTFCR